MELLDEFLPVLVKVAAMPIGDSNHFGHHATRVFAEAPGIENQAVEYLFLFFAVPVVGLAASFVIKPVPLPIGPIGVRYAQQGEHRLAEFIRRSLRKLGLRRFLRHGALLREESDTMPLDNLVPKRCTAWGKGS